ncbi:MAG TPA: hypothetical protein VF598_10690 [Hymenobacter sp.]|jgi:ribosomal protein L18
MCAAVTRQTNTQKRHARIRAAFRDRYTNKPRPRLYSREYIISQLAEEYCLSMATIESIIWTKAKEAKKV